MARYRAGLFGPRPAVTQCGRLRGIGHDRLFSQAPRGGSNFGFPIWCRIASVCVAHDHIRAKPTILRNSAASARKRKS